MARRADPVRQAAETRRIARAAAELFRARTYLDTSMDGIAKAARISKGALYHYFKRKSDVLFHILDRAMDDLLAGAEDVQGPDGRAKLEALVTRQIRYYSDHLAEVRTLLNDRHCLPPAQRRTIEAKQQAYFDLLREQVDACLDRHAAPTPLTFALFGMCNWIPSWYRPTGALDVEALARLTLRLFFDGLNGFKRKDA